jgi:hypothetical protein
MVRLNFMMKRLYRVPSPPSNKNLIAPVLG